MATRNPAAAGQAAARQAGADAAVTVIYAQLRAGMPARRIEQSAEQVLASRATCPTPVSEAFYDAYGEVARTYAAAARTFGLDTLPSAGTPAEAGRP